jgi:hypothetical protein
MLSIYQYLLHKNIPDSKVVQILFKSCSASPFLIFVCNVNDPPSNGDSLGIADEGYMYVGVHW